MGQVKFLKNWNNKLNNNYFLTVRLHTPSKKRYYTNQIINFEKVNVLLGKNEELYCRAKLVYMDIDLFKNIPEWLSYVDSGLSKTEFYNLLEEFYKDKKEWKGKYTKLIILCYMRVDGNV